MSTLTPSRIAAEVEYFAERAQAMADARADAEYERRCNAEQDVTFDELMEEAVSAISDDDKAEFMRCVASGDRASCSLIYLELWHARERVVNRLMVKGE